MIPINVKICMMNLQFLYANVCFTIKENQGRIKALLKIIGEGIVKYGFRTLPSEMTIKNRLKYFIEVSEFYFNNKQYNLNRRMNKQVIEIRNSYRNTLLKEDKEILKKIQKIICKNCYASKERDGQCALCV
ncbi:hypothetical protein ECANGB1_1272 [Enterospora canceri]|uniref:Uncharacterized protein n=1 Tax=Enterospora canceri TaxID=1081671 RepID=A0A1Y1S6E3_9MICR|nr:hypothetical protein ECANGB1_1272 [Enterospora canceri]